VAGGLGAISGQVASIAGPEDRGISGNGNSPHCSNTALKAMITLLRSTSINLPPTRRIPRN